MRRITTLFIMACIAAGAYAQEIPAELTAKLEAKAAQLHPNNESGAKAWLRKQSNSWEAIQFMSFTADERDVKLIKQQAEKKFPLDYVAQEGYITEQSSLLNSLTDLKVQLGKDGYEAARKKYDSEGKTDLKLLEDTLRTQIDAKIALDTIKPEGIDAMTFAITKEVIAKQFPNDYKLQLVALKKQLNLHDGAQNTPQAGAATVADNSANSQTAEDKPEMVKEKRPMNMGELNKKAKEDFNKLTFIAEGANKKCTTLAAEIAGRQCVIVPFNAYSPDSPLVLLNNLGEEVVYNKDEVFASKTLPVLLIFPTEVPANTLNANFTNEKQFREIIGKNIFFTGYTTTNIQSFPIKINAISETQLALSTKIPNNFQEGTLLLDPETDLTGGILLASQQKFSEINWKDRSAVNKFLRSIDKQNTIIYLSCYRLDKIGQFEKIDPEKFRQNEKDLAAMRDLNVELTKIFLDSRIAEIAVLSKIGPIVKKHQKNLLQKQEKSRFERAARTYVQDIAQLIKIEIRDVKPNEFYTYNRDEAIYIYSSLVSMYNVFQSALKANAFIDFVPTEAKRVQKL